MEQDFAASIPDFAFRLIQLAELPYEKITGTPAGILVLRVLKAEQSGQLLGGEVWEEALMALALREIFELVLRYILLAGDIDRAAFGRKFYELATCRIKTTALIPAQQFRQDRRQEGQVLAQQCAVLEALQIRFGQVPETSRCAILGITDAARLHSLHGEAIRCPSLESFARVLTSELAFEQREGDVFYFDGQVPLFSHPVEDLASFRFFTSQLIANGNATQNQISKAFGMPLITVKRGCKKLRTQGAAGFFRPSPPRHGHTLTAKRLAAAQAMLDQGLDMPAIGAALGVQPNTLHKAVSDGRLKKGSGLEGR